MGSNGKWVELRRFTEVAANVHEERVFWWITKFGPNAGREFLK